jgi:hypothetical protein
MSIRRIAGEFVVDRPVGGASPTCLDYSIDFAEKLRAGESISSSVVTCDGLEVDRESRDGSVVSAFVTGGIAGTTYRLIFTITTDQGRVIPAALRLRCVLV